MKHTIAVNDKNAIEHIIHLDQHLPITIKALPHNTAYQLEKTPIHTTTTQTLHKTTITQIRQKNKKITRKTHLIIIQNTKTQPELQIKTIQENPQITIHHTNTKELTKTLQEILENKTPPPTRKISIHENTLYHDDKPIKTYNNKKYLQLIKKELEKNPHLTLQQAQYQAQRQYYKYISYDKTNHAYKLTIKQKTITIHRKLKDAIEEKIIRTKNKDTDEETLCHEKIPHIEKLPPTPWTNPQNHMTREHGKYQTTMKTLHNNPDTITHIEKQETPRQTILNAQKPDRNIIKKTNTYNITRQNNNTRKTLYQAHDKNKIRYIRDKLEENQYDTRLIPQYETQYTIDKDKYQKSIQQQYKIIDYYKNTTTKLTRKHDTKEEYQTRQIQIRKAYCRQQKTR